MNLVETLKSVGGVKPCPDQLRGFQHFKCPQCHGTGQILDLAPLLAWPNGLTGLVSQLRLRLYELWIASGNNDPIGHVEPWLTNLHTVGPQRASNLIYEFARQLGGTAVVAEHFGPTSEYAKDWLKCEYYKVAERLQDEEYRLLSGQRSPREQQEYERAKCLCRKIGDFLFGDYVVRGDPSFVRSCLKTQEEIANLGREGYRLLGIIPNNATVLFVTDRLDEQEMRSVISCVKGNSCGHDYDCDCPRIKKLPYVLSLISATEKFTPYESKEGEEQMTPWKVISLHAEK